MLGILEKISPSELVSNSYISNHNKVRRPRPKFKVSLFLIFLLFWINVTQINFEFIIFFLQRIISDSYIQLKSRFNVDARAPSIPLLNFLFKTNCQSVAHNLKLFGERKHWIMKVNGCSKLQEFIICFLWCEKTYDWSSAQIYGLTELCHANSL